MRKELKIPTLIALLVLMVALVATAFATNFAQTIFTRASVTSAPQEVKISNVSDSTFSVSWITDEAVSGAVVAKAGTQGFAQPVLDDRVEASTANDKFFTHHVSLRFLQPATNYTFKIVSGSKEYSDSKYTVTTPAKAAGNTTTIPAYGMVEKSAGVPLSGGIVYVTINGSSLLSSLTKPSGSWLVPLNLARTADLSSLLSINQNGDPINIFVQAGRDGVAQAKTVTGKEAPVDTIVIGQNSDFTQSSSSTPSPTLMTEPSPTNRQNQGESGFGLEEEATAGPKIVSPSDDATLTDTQPTFEGTAQPGQVIQITVESENKYSATVVANDNGRWNWTVPDDLEPGEHTVTMKVTDEKGEEKVIAHKFLVLASGTSVTESATPSATFTPTPTLEPEPSASPSPIPVSGDLSPTMNLLFFAVALISISGTVFYSASLKK